MLLLFWICSLILFYHLIGYPMILFFVDKNQKKNCKDNIVNKLYPSVTILCPAYNEVNVIENKILSVLGLNYPKEKLKLIVISDESTDGTNEIVEKYSKLNENVKLVIQSPRKGKPSGHNLVRSMINSDYIISTDANSIFDPDAINQLLHTFSANDNVGIVSGCLKLQSKDGVDSGEGLYWRYESRIKQLESNIYSILGSNGSIFMIRRDLFKEVHPASVDDFERTLQVLNKGYIGKYNGDAVVYEYSTEKPHEEIKRKVRIISREWFALMRNATLLNPFRFPKVSIMLFSHKILRWLLGFFTLGLLFSSIMLSENIFFGLISLSIVFILSVGSIELFIEAKGQCIKPLKPFAYFTAMNYAAILAFIKFLVGQQQTTWNTIREEK